MKKVAIISLCLILIALILSSCDPNHINPSKEELENVVLIELIRYNNPDQKEFISWVPDHSDDLASFDNSRVEIIEILDNEKFDDFSTAFQSTEILHTYYMCDSPNGVCIRVNYENGEFLIIGKDYIGYFSENGEVSSFLGCFSGRFYYTDLVNEFFEYQVSED